MKYLVMAALSLIFVGCVTNTNKSELEIASTLLVKAVVNNGIPEGKQMELFLYGAKVNGVALGDWKITVTKIDKKKESK